MSLSELRSRSTSTLARSSSRCRRLSSASTHPPTTDDAPPSAENGTSRAEDSRTTPRPPPLPFLPSPHQASRPRVGPASADHGLPRLPPPVPSRAPHRMPGTSPSLPSPPFTSTTVATPSLPPPLPSSTPGRFRPRRTSLLLSLALRHRPPTSLSLRSRSTPPSSLFTTDSTPFLITSTLAPSSTRFPRWASSHCRPVPCAG